MKRDGLIKEWTDEEIYAGSTLHNVISDALNSSEVFLALLSPDYIASDYCYNKEFEAAQRMQDEGKLIIVPIILEPCDWKKTPFGNLKALSKDGKAVSEWTNPNNVDGLRRLITFTKSTSSIQNTLSSSAPEKLVRNYKVKKTFSEVDKYNFKETSYQEIKNYFQASVSELDSAENLQARFTNDGKGFFTCLISNRANNQSSFLTVQVGGDGQRHFGDLSYVFSEQIQSNSFQMNKAFKIENDDYNQFWSKNSQGFVLSSQSQIRLSAHQVAEEIWNEFISEVGVSLD